MCEKEEGKCALTQRVLSVEGPLMGPYKHVVRILRLLWSKGDKIRKSIVATTIIFIVHFVH